MKMALNLPICKMNIEWYALQVKTGNEAEVAQRVETRGFDTILPYVPIFIKRSEKLSIMKRPMLPGYVLVQADLSSIYLLMQKERLGFPQKIVRICGNGYSPIPLDEDEISFFRMCSQSMAPLVFNKEQIDRHHHVYTVVNSPPWMANVEINNYDRKHFQADASIWCGRLLQMRSFGIAAYPSYYDGVFASQLKSLS